WYRAASDDLAASLRGIVDQDLTGSAAEKYHHQAYKLGKPLNITIKGMDGKLVSTVDWKGKVIVIDFWATWCGPCVAALPKLVQLYQTNHSRGLEILGISNDTSLPALKEFLAKHKEMVWPESFNPVGQEPWNALSPQMGIHSIPTAFLIDRNGILRDIEQNYLDEATINQCLDETAKPDAASGPSAKFEATHHPAI